MKRKASGGANKDEIRTPAFISLALPGSRYRMPPALYASEIRAGIFLPNWSNMAKKNWIYVKRGLSENPKHRAQMGEAIWLFLHIIDRADWEMGIAYDWKDEQEAADMGMSVRTLRDQRRKLDELNYISCKQKQYGQDIIIKNWINPRDYSGKVINQGGSETEPSESAQGYAQGNSQSVTPTSDSVSLSIENSIFADVPVTEQTVQITQLRDIAPKMFEAALGFSKPLPWWQGKDWTTFGEWVCAEYEKSKTSFGEYNIWRNTPYTKGGMANTRIRGFVNEFYDSWDMFQMSKPKQNDEPDWRDRSHAL